MLVQILGAERCIEVGVYTVCPSFFNSIASSCYIVNFTNFDLHLVEISAD
jgi:hypothetical protein